jgi:hypothetical protein
MQGAAAEVELPGGSTIDNVAALVGHLEASKPEQILCRGAVEEGGEAVPAFLRCEGSVPRRPAPLLETRARLADLWRQRARQPPDAREVSLHVWPSPPPPACAWAAVHAERRACPHSDPPPPPPPPRACAPSPSSSLCARTCVSARQTTRRATPPATTCWSRRGECAHTLSSPP